MEATSTSTRSFPDKAFSTAASSWEILPIASRARQAPTGEKVSVLGKSRMGDFQSRGFEKETVGVREAWFTQEFHHWVPR